MQPSFIPQLTNLADLEELASTTQILTSEPGTLTSEDVTTAAEIVNQLLQSPNATEVRTGDPSQSKSKDWTQLLKNSILNVFAERQGGSNSNRQPTAQRFGWDPRKQRNFGVKRFALWMHTCVNRFVGVGATTVAFQVPTSSSSYRHQDLISFSPCFLFDVKPHGDAGRPRREPRPGYQLVSVWSGSAKPGGAVCASSHYKHKRSPVHLARR